MASSYHIIKPNGTKLQLLSEPGQNRIEIVQTLLLDHWEKYCNRNWMSSSTSNLYQEKKVKNFLDRIAYFLLQGSQGVISDYKEKSFQNKEIVASSCPSRIQDYFDSGGRVLHSKIEDEESRFNSLIESLEDKEKKKPRRKPKKENLLRGKYKSYLVEYCTVDTENIFSYMGVEYEIDQSIECYQPKQTKEGFLYDMDKIVVASKDNEIQFLSQNLEPLPHEKIRRCANGKKK